MFQLFPLRQGEHERTEWKRRDLILKKCEDKITVKLWGNFSDLVTEEVEGKELTIKQVEVPQYNGNHNGTVMTEV